MKNIILILIALSQMTCASYNSPVNSKGKMASGIVLDEISREPIIGQTIYEFQRHANNTLTDTSGKFQIEFIGNSPIIELTGTYEPIITEIEIEKENIINLDLQTSRKTKKLLKQIHRRDKKIRKSWEEFPIDGAWKVIDINYQYSQQYDYIDEIDPDQRPKKLKRQFPQELKIGDELQIRNNRIIVNSLKEYDISKGSQYMYISITDVVYTYEIEVENINQLRFRKETTVGETEWIIGRK